MSAKSRRRIRRAARTKRKFYAKVAHRSTELVANGSFDKDLTSQEFKGLVSQLTVAIFPLMWERRCRTRTTNATLEISGSLYSLVI